MKLLIISSSQRSPSQSANVGRYIAENSQQFSSIAHLELCQYRLPFWDGDRQSEQLLDSDWPQISQQVAAADALVLITPEWGGMASPLLKNFLLLCDNQHTAHKPTLLVAVSSGISGAYPIAELKMNALKNNKLVAIPDHLIIRNSNKVLQQGGHDPRDADLKQRIGYSLHMLHQYSTALSTIRNNHQDRPYPKQQEYSYGM
ncbi:NAD(P)H-dependent oxidoreductase [Shewanella sp. Isolate11]|uniref:NAD(P)H-dependent oxidoreductase n=1 Tax=Shewanella sp. Isolate11 TaxID=2908530 RepID=UPI001EFD2EC1|nr:NAD(P)H-dependent oxidoreductase [Shewanella sp. Isolate11]MCG9695836.1 NAD(P)H-dependent oxidoreductase [Shewanella sp. Isolate11]